MQLGLFAVGGVLLRYYFKKHFGEPQMVKED